MKKLIIIIPAYNEERTIAAVIENIPRKIEGLCYVEVLLIDDGSTDQTISNARRAGVDQVICGRHQGLARTFKKGLEEALKRNADFIVNLDADGQYAPQELTKIVQPLLESRADIVSGNRQIEKLRHMPPMKKLANTLGSFFIRLTTGLEVKDASSGFRAFTKEAALHLNILSDHTYTHETLIQAAANRLKVEEIPIKFLPRRDKSRLIKSLFDHIRKSSLTILRSLLMYHSLRIFVLSGGLLLLTGVLFGIRYLYFFFGGDPEGHVQSLILSSILISSGFTTIILGILADLTALNRKLIEDLLLRRRSRAIARSGATPLLKFKKSDE